MKKGLFLLFSLFLSSVAFSSTLPSDIKPTDLRSYGDKNSPTTLYVFSSLTCPHCSHYHAEIMPKLKKDYVDSGKVRLVYVDMPFDPISMTGTTISRCVKVEKYEDFMNLMFENQSMLLNSGKPRGVMTRFATMLGGITPEEISVCLANEELKKKIIEQRTNLSNLYEVEAMPTTVIVRNNSVKKIEGADEVAIIAEIEKGLK